MSQLKDAIDNILNGQTAKAKEEVNSILYSKVEDQLSTKKMEISANWLNGLEAPEEQ